MSKKLSTTELLDLEEKGSNFSLVAVGETEDGDVVRVPIDRVIHAIAFEKMGYEIEIADEDTKKAGRPKKETE